MGISGKFGIVLLAVVLLGGCSAGTGEVALSPTPSSTVAPGPTPSSTASPAPTPTPTPEPVAEAVPARLVVSTMHLRVVAAGGEVIHEIGIYDPIGPAVDILTDIFAAEPVVTAYDGTAAVDYDWEGFSIATDGPADPPTRAEVYFRAMAAELNGIIIETADGFSVGDSLIPISEAAPEDTRTWDNQGVQEMTVDVDEVPLESDGSDRALHTELTAHPADGPISRISAPAKNFE